MFTLPSSRLWSTASIRDAHFSRLSSISKFTRASNLSRSAASCRFFSNVSQPTLMKNPRRTSPPPTAASSIFTKLQTTLLYHAARRRGYEILFYKNILYSYLLLGRNRACVARKEQTRTSKPGLSQPTRAVNSGGRGTRGRQLESQYPDTTLMSL